MEDLETLIEDQITDAELPDSTEVEASGDVPDPVPEPETTDNTEQSSDSIEVKSPSAEKKDDKVEDDFDKKYGLSQQSASGRENRIPYSRVRKITDKAVKDAQATWSKDLETSHVPTTKFQELDTKVKDYETRLTQVAQFEEVMAKEPERFLTMLSGIPAYQQFFQRIQELATIAQNQNQNPKAEAPVVDDMPQPDHQMTDGSWVYSMDGVKKLQEWNRVQAKKEALAEVEGRFKTLEDKYAPMTKDYEQFQARQAVLPGIQKQISEARQWPLFNDSEAEIVAALDKNPSWNLERAYQSVVLPKLQSNRDAMRQELLAEVKKAPKATTATTSTVKPGTRASNEPKSLEDVIAASIQGVNGR